MADIKQLLKEARKHIDEKNYKDAQECCKNLLRKDKQNYFGLVLLGKSFQDSDQACLAYQKAIACKPSHPLAWLGLASYYEAHDDQIMNVKLLPVYVEILKLQIEEEKALEIISKIGKLGVRYKNGDVVETLINYLKEEPPTTLRKSAEEQLICLINENIPCGEPIIPALLEILPKLITTSSDQNELLQSKIILQKTNFSLAVEEIIEKSYFKENIVVREWLCNQLCKKYVENMCFFGLDIEKHIETIISGVVNSKYPDLLKSMIAFEKGFYLDAYKFSVPLINYHEPEFTEGIFIIKCTMKLQKWSVAQKLATNFLTKVKDSRFCLELNKNLFYSLVKQQKWQSALLVSKNIQKNSHSIQDSFNVDELASVVECLIEVGEPFDDLLNELQSTNYYESLKALSFLKQGKFDDVVNLLQNSNLENSINVFYLGKAYWELKKYNEALLNLLKSARLNSEHFETFIYLGHFYYHTKNDLLKAKKCYEKAYSLNNLDGNLLRSLSDVYLKLKLTDMDFEMLTTISKTTNESWIHFRLGLHYLNRKEWENAIIYFRNVVKINQNDTTAFECLADAYYCRGSYTSALKAYNRLLTLDPNKAIHCLTRSGYIFSLLTQHEEAICTFQKVLSMDPNCILAVKGIAETWIRISKKKIAAKVFGSARDCAQKAVDYLTDVLEKQTNKQFTCLWKLLGDTLIMVTKLPMKYAYIYMSELSNESVKVKKELLDIFSEAIKCYSYISKQKQQFASYDLATTYLAYYNVTKKVVNCHIAFNLTMTCIKEKPQHWRSWNLLGKIGLYVKKYEIAQHCFIKALLSTRKWSVAKIWCNLGTLYLKLKLYRLANYCFWRGQSTLPSYPHSWIGQGLIAEVIREEEAMDLFRHASRLGYHSESALAYADWVCRVFNNKKYQEDPEYKYEIQGLYAVTCAMDLMQWFCDFDSKNPCALTILGILQEQSLLLRSALKSYEKALQYCEGDKKNIALLNMGRILTRMGNYDDAINAYKSITEASLNSTTGLALALFKKGFFEEAYSAYETALQWLSETDEDKADLLVAMASSVYTQKGVNDTKTLLFRSIQASQKKPTAHSLFAVCSLGLLHADKSLSKLAICEMQKYDKDDEFVFDIGFLKSYLHVYDENMNQATKFLSDSLHDFPSNALLWFCMAQYCLMETNLKAKVSSRCSQRALSLAQNNESNINLAKLIATASVAEFIAGDRVRAFILAKQGLHLFPCQPEIWAAVLRSLVSHKIWLFKKPCIMRITDFMRKNLNISRRLAKWITLVEKKLSR